jgi:hypothetical protein
MGILLRVSVAWNPGGWKFASGGLHGWQKVRLDSQSPAFSASAIAPMKSFNTYNIPTRPDLYSKIALSEASRWVFGEFDRAM